MPDDREAPELVLVLGGARSGKSDFAEQVVARFGSRVLYVATAELRDDEMVERVKRHRTRRPPQWQTVEAPFDPVAAITSAGGSHDAVLLDCLSFWISNLLLAATPPEEARSANDAEEVVDRAVKRLLTWQKQSNRPLVVVSAETGLGIVPEHALGRLFRDLLGQANQQMARESDRVYLIVAGLGVDIKALARSPLPPAE